jgi:hypothetical protein
MPWPPITSICDESTTDRPIVGAAPELWRSEGQVGPHGPSFVRARRGRGYGDQRATLVVGRLPHRRPSNSLVHTHRREESAKFGDR